VSRLSGADMSSEPMVREMDSAMLHRAQLAVCQRVIDKVLTVPQAREVLVTLGLDARYV